METMFFGSSRRPLFGTYHEPQQQSRGVAVVLCPPVGHEYIRAHRALRNLAALLSRSGFHAFRFDYSSTGDSSGTGEEARVGEWVSDVQTAVEEVQGISAVTRVSIVGVRFGATLASMAAETCEADIEGLLLWDPVVSGAEYLASLRQVEAKWLLTRPKRGDVRHDDPPELFGFPLPETLRRDFESADLTRVAQWRARRISVFDSIDHVEGDRLCRHLAAANVPHSHQAIADHTEWRRPEKVHAALLPHQMVQALVKDLEERS